MGVEGPRLTAARNISRNQETETETYVGGFARCIFRPPETIEEHLTITLIAYALSIYHTSDVGVGLDGGIYGWCLAQQSSSCC